MAEPGIDGTPAWAYDEDNYCVVCGNGRWKHHMPDCMLRDAIDVIARSADAVVRLIEIQEALELIAGDRQCENYTNPPYCRQSGSTRTRDAKYHSDRWCGVCIARDALERAT